MTRQIEDLIKAGTTLVEVLAWAPADCRQEDDLCALHNAEWSTRKGHDLGHCEWIEARLAAVSEWRASRDALRDEVFA